MLNINFVLRCCRCERGDHQC